MYRTQDNNIVLAGPASARRAAAAPRGVTPQQAKAAARPAVPSSGKQIVRLRREEPFSLRVDLGANIGSRDWFRGAATCLALCYGAIAMAPDITAIPGLSPDAMSADQYDEARTLGIDSASTGGATGRRMAPTDAVQPLVDPPERPTVELRAGLSSAGDVAGALTRAGVSQYEAGQAANLIAQAVTLGEIPAGTTLELRLGRRLNPSDPRPLEQLAFRASFALRVELNRVDDRLTLNRQAIAVDSTPLRIQSLVGPSLYRSARAATGETEVGELLYAGLSRTSGRNLQIMRWQNADGQVQWFEASGVGRQSSTGFRMPVPNGRQTSPFGNRFHPILRYMRMHTGIDIGAPYGSQIVAAAPGRVILAGWSGGYGRSVRIDHGGGISTVYGHMSGVSVQTGQTVAAGQLIGSVGSTGLSTGPHLHYEVRRNGNPVNPAGFAFVNRPQLDGGELASFRSRMQALLAVPIGARPMPNANTPGFASLPTSTVPAPMPRVAQTVPQQPARTVQQAPARAAPGDQGVW